MVPLTILCVILFGGAILGPKMICALLPGPEPYYLDANGYHHPGFRPVPPMPLRGYRGYPSLDAAFARGYTPHR